MTKDLQCIHRAGCPKPAVCGEVGHCTSMTSTDCRLRTPQGEPALTLNGELPGTREPAVIEPKGNTGGSPASLSSNGRLEVAWRTYTLNKGFIGPDIYQVVKDAFTAAWHAGLAKPRSAHETTVPRLSTKVNGVGRDKDLLPRCLVVYFDGVPTDDDLRAVHDLLRHAHETESTQEQQEAAMPSNQLVNPPRCTCATLHVPGVLTCPSGEAIALRQKFLIDCLRRICAPAGWTLVELCDWAANFMSRSAVETPAKRDDTQCANCGQGWSAHLTNKLICPDAAIADVYRFRDPAMPQVETVERRRPTIEELEAILAKPEGTYVVKVNLDGSIRADEVSPEKDPACPKCEAVRKLGLKSCFEHKQQVNGPGEQ